MSRTTLLFAALLLTTSLSARAENVHYTIDPAHTYPSFEADHMGISVWRGKLDKSSGGVDLDKVAGTGHVDVTLDLSSIDFGLDALNTWATGKDFFDVANHPTIRFVSKRIDGDIQRKFRVVGDLTIRGVTREVTLDATNEGSTKDPWGNDRVGISAFGKLNRNDFGLTWNQALEAGGVLVGEDVKLSFDVELVQQVAQTSVAA